MPVHPQPTDPPPPMQLAALTEDPWHAEIVPLLPADLAAQARALGAFRRVRKVATPTDLLRALLAGALDQLSTRGLGCAGREVHPARPRSPRRPRAIVVMHRLHRREGAGYPRPDGLLGQHRRSRRSPRAKWGLPGGPTGSTGRGSTIPPG